MAPQRGGADVSDYLHPEKDSRGKDHPFPVDRKLRARVFSYNARKGQAVVILDSGARVVVPWSALKLAPALAPGEKVFLAFDQNGDVKTIKIWRDDLSKNSIR
jgi:hypothetical protein